LSLGRIEVAGTAVYDGDMAKASAVIEQPEVRVQPTGMRPPTVLAEFDRQNQKRVAAWFKKWRGKIHLDIDVDELRGRRR
jgi:hypothetical protein